MTPGDAPRLGPACSLRDDSKEVLLGMGAAGDVVVTRLATPPDALRAAAALLSDMERQRASRFISDRHRDRFVFARARLRELLAERLSVRPQAVEFIYGSHGKPALGGRLARSELRFNLSHCDELAVYAFSTSSEIGVDVEALRILVDADALAARFFSPQERKAYHALPPYNRPLAFFHCWTRKEAFLKARGEGLCCPLDAFDVSLAPGEPARILRVGNSPGAHSRWSLQSFSPAPGHVAALASPFATAA